VLLSVVVAALVLPRVARVPDDDMAPTLLAGDLVIILPIEARLGDVVAVVDPLDPARWTLRRVQTIGGAIRYEDGIYYASDVEPPGVLEMGRDTDRVVRTEGPHLVRLAPRAVRWELPEETVPDYAAFLGADARDEAVDSRWWGPMPLQALQGVVVLRIGVPNHPWRGWFDGRA
jgi:signal peptidase I